MHWLIKNSILLLIYAAFLIFGGLYLRGWLRYRGVESWPSVNAEIVGGGGNLSSVPNQTRYGSGSTTIDTRFVEFQYSVEGKTYRSKTGSPDSGGLPAAIVGEPSWKAFYKPSSPEIAVLSPTPFSGELFLFIAALSGIIVLVHIGCGVSDWLHSGRECEPTGAGDDGEAI
jgi:Protein of unknown function (DUF3592)